MFKGSECYINCQKVGDETLVKKDPDQFLNGSLDKVNETADPFHE